MDNEKTNRRREALALVTAIAVVLVFDLGHMLIGDTGTKAPDIVTDNQKAVDPDDEAEALTVPPTDPDRAREAARSTAPLVE